MTPDEWLDGHYLRTIGPHGEFLGWNREGTPRRVIIAFYQAAFDAGERSPSRMTAEHFDMTINAVWNLLAAARRYGVAIPSSKPRTDPVGRLAAALEVDAELLAMFARDAGVVIRNRAPAAKLGRGSAWINSAPTSPPSSSSRSSPASCS